VRVAPDREARRKVTTVEFKEKISSILSDPMTASGIEVLQVNMGYRCNMSCAHCHVGAGPARREEMKRETVESVLDVMRVNGIRVLDITGGAPELNPHFRYLVKEAGRLGCRVIVRTNLTVFFESGMDDLPEFFRDNGVELVASLPCYMGTNVDGIRGKGAFQKSIRAIKMLNDLGYGMGPSGGKLNLVYNPAGAFLPPSQEALENDYKRELGKRFGISFNSLYTFANMPVGRFRDSLVHTNNLERYMEELRAAFNPATIEGLMCRHLISIGWDGTLYDCDFNQALGFPVDDVSPHITGFDHERLNRRRIAVSDHCYGCTAGQGST
jgi:radical SAM/Cys-rich protein